MIRMTFGKHRGKRLEDIPAAYLRWVLRNVANLDADLKAAIEAEYGRRGVAKKKPLNRREEYQAGARKPLATPIDDVMLRTVNVLATGERTDVFQPGPLLDELWELIAETHAEIRRRESPAEAWRFHLRALTGPLEN